METRTALTNKLYDFISFRVLQCGDDVYNAVVRIKDNRVTARIRQGHQVEGDATSWHSMNEWLVTDAEIQQAVEEFKARMD